MGRLPGESDEAWLARYLPHQKERLRWIDQALKQGTMPVFRYEDLVLDLPGQARRLEEWLGVGLDPAAVVNGRQASGPRQRRYARVVDWPLAHRDAGRACEAVQRRAGR